MRDASALPTMTVEEYFRFEESSEIKHEYVAGEVYAMSGGTVRHDRIATNVLVRLSLVARPGPCDVFSSNMRVEVARDRSPAELTDPAQVIVSLVIRALEMRPAHGS